MSVTASLPTTKVAVTPGSEATVELRVRNTGHVVDVLTIEVVGASAAWATVSPDHVSLFPGTDAAVAIVFRPPMTAECPAGEVPFGVRVRSQEDAEGSVVEEGVLDVAPFLAVAAELVPRTSRGRKSAVHELAIENRGTRPISATVAAADAEGHLLFALDPPALVVAPDAAAFVKVRLRAAKPFRKGPPLTRMFEVVVSEGDQSLVSASGMMVQEETVPRWVRKALLLTLAAVALLALLWFALAKPAVESAAKEAAREELTPPTIAATTASGGTAAGAASGARSGETAVAPAAAASADGSGAGGAGSTIDGRLFLTASGATAYEVPAGSVLQVTDIVLQNPGGDGGSLQIRRNGTPLLVVELANFRDLDYHFVAPIVFTAGQKLELAADCTTPGCTPGAYFAGYLVKG